jgi:DNA invertase Pin-like site-specific DNA recombinase
LPFRNKPESLVLEASGTGDEAMLVGYARVSTLEQVASIEAQEVELGSIGCQKVFTERISSIESRPQLEAALDFVREGDCLVVSKLDRLARSVIHLCGIVQRLELKNVGLRILNINLDTSTATGRLMLNMLAAVAEFERQMLLERQKVGIAKARVQGRYKGRKPTARAKREEVRKLWHEGLGPVTIARQLKISRASVYRCLT